MSPQNLEWLKFFSLPAPPSSVLVLKMHWGGGMHWLPTSILFAIPETSVSFQQESQKWHTHNRGVKYFLLKHTSFVRSSNFILDFGRLWGLPFGNHKCVELILLVSVDSAGGLKCQFELYMPGLYWETVSSCKGMSEPVAKLWTPLLVTSQFFVCCQWGSAREKEGVRQKSEGGSLDTFPSPHPLLSMTRAWEGAIYSFYWIMPLSQCLQASPSPPAAVWGA